MLRYIPSLHKYILYILYVYSFFTSYTYILFFLIIIYIYLYICKLVQFRLICRNYLNLGSFVRQVRIYFNISLRKSRILASNLSHVSVLHTFQVCGEFSFSFFSSFHPSTPCLSLALPFSRYNHREKQESQARAAKEKNKDKKPKRRRRKSIKRENRVQLLRNAIITSRLPNYVILLTLRVKQSHEARARYEKLCVATASRNRS